MSSDSAVEPTAHSWHTLEVQRVLDMLASSADQGLSADEVRTRIAQHGPNVLAEGRKRGPMRILLAQFTDVMVLVLIGAALVASFLGEPEDIVAIVAVVVLNAVLGFAQEYRAERAVSALKAMATPAARARRSAVDAIVPSEELVPGDIVLLEAGSIVPADLRLLTAHRLRVDEAMLTGESQPVEKTIDPIAKPDLALGDKRNMAYKGTTVVYGRGLGIVIATGMGTELGRIAALLRDEDETRTPLQKRLSRFGRNLAVAVLTLCAVILIAGLLRGEDPVRMFMTALSLAVAAIPEALPAVVTISLAFGARKMVRQHALIRRLPAVETLGSVTYICTDKTGTLTENRMRVETVQAGDLPTAPAPAGAAGGALALIFEAVALNNDATRGPDGELSGDPTETALYRAAASAGRDKSEVEGRLPRVAELPFSSERARMTTVHRDGDSFIAYSKGAPERVLASCIDRFTTGGTKALDRQAALADAERMALSGLRVLGVAMRRLTSLPSRLEDVESEQTFLGLVGLMDPPRREAPDAVALCQTAGIRVVMITGDHPGTARAIAGQLGIAAVEDAVITGAELTAMSDEDLDARVQHLRVYARVDAEDKLRIVKALHQRGEYVAMTGDGVNDAPALRRADIGIAMGMNGTDVAREASDMVLLDDNFATIVNAVREGRRIYDNIRRFVRYSLSTNSGEILTLFIAPFIGLPLPLLPIHILWMNLVTDGLPGLALAAEPPERNIMSRPPRRPAESIFADGLWQHASWVGLLMAGLALGMQAWAIHIGDAHWQSMTFTVLTLSSLSHVLAVRSERESLFQQGITTNRPLLGAILLTFGLQMATLYVPAFSRQFKTTPLTGFELLGCIGVASVVFVAVEAEKWLIRSGRLYGTRPRQ
ncbi:MAG: cation-translocating P-type ATPase [Gemmatimonadaceae bacterium]